MKTFFLMHEAHMASAFLESHGIQSKIKNEVISQVYNFGTPSNPLVELLVDPSDFDQAKELIESSFEEEIGSDYEEKSSYQEVKGANKKGLIVGVFFLGLLILLLLKLQGKL